ncbi:hypothetical protein KDA82_39285, partial [Streptomyces daliensis]|nr:hypothetical protein [Streptomyces daliensis]
LSVHAGALEFRPDAPPEEIAGAAGVIRGSAHQALEELREVIGVLRAGSPVRRDGPAGPEPEGAGSAGPGTGTGGGEPEGSGRPQPRLADVARLVRESREAGTRVTLRQR